MKVIQLAALFGGAVSAIQPLVDRADGTTTTVVYTTSTYTITKCAASVTNCPVASATEVYTSTTVMSVTTTICQVTSTPGFPPPQSEYLPSSVLSPILSTNTPGTAGTTGTLSDSVPTSYPPGVSAPSSAYVPPVQSSALPSGSSRSIDVSVSMISPNPSLPTTGTDSVSTSFPPDTSGPLSSYIPPVQSSAQPTGPSGSGTVIVPRPSPSGSVSLPGSLTDSVPTSFPAEALASSSLSGYVPVQPSASAGSSSTLPTADTNTGSAPTSSLNPSSGYGQFSTPGNTITDAVPTSGHSASIADPSSGVYTPSVSSNTDAVPTSGYPGSSAVGSSVVPSGSNSAPGLIYTVTDAVLTFGYPSLSVPTPDGTYSSLSPSNTATDAVPTPYPASSAYDGPSSTGSVGTNTDSVPTSSGLGSSGPSSSGYATPDSTALPTQGTPSTDQDYPSGTNLVVLSSSPPTATGTYPTVTSMTSSVVYPASPPLANTTVIDVSTRITSRLTLASTNYVTVSLPSSNPSTDTATDAVPTSRGTGYLPSGSGYPYPSGSTNGTVAAPTPSYIEVPVNMGQIVAVGQGPIAAIVIALAFALFA